VEEDALGGVREGAAVVVVVVVVVVVSFDRTATCREDDQQGEGEDGTDS
jgi:hypothetical protein